LIEKVSLPIYLPGIGSVSFSRSKRMTVPQSGSIVSASENFNMQALSDLTGFPIEMLQKELHLTAEDIENGISLEILREKMLNYVDQVMLNS
jgi:hypothetical protein